MPNNLPTTSDQTQFIMHALEENIRKVWSIARELGIEDHDAADIVSSPKIPSNRPNDCSHWDPSHQARSLLAIMTSSRQIVLLENNFRSMWRIKLSIATSQERCSKISTLLSTRFTPQSTTFLLRELPWSQLKSRTTVARLKIRTTSTCLRARKIDQ